MASNIREDARYDGKHTERVECAATKESLENESKSVKSEKMMRYTMQLVFLRHLLSEKLITEEEYKKIGQQLMSDYGVVSNLTV